MDILKIKDIKELETVNIKLEVTIKDICSVLLKNGYKISEYNIKGCIQLIEEGLSYQMEFYSCKDILKDLEDNFTDVLE